MPVRQTYCRHCTSSCGLDVEVLDNKIVGLKGDPGSVTQGYSCMMGQHSIHLYDGATRLYGIQQKQPDGGFRDVGNAPALADIAARLQALIAQYGPRCVALYYGTGTAYGGLAYSMAKTFLQAIGSPELYTSMTVDQSSRLVTAARMGRFVTGKPYYTELDAMLLVGTNPVVSHQGAFMPRSHPLKRMADARRRGIKLIVVDPRRSETAQRADLHLQIRPGQDAMLIAGLVREILEQGWQDQAFCERFITSMAALKRAVADFTPGLVAERTGLSVEQILQAARIFAGGRALAASGTGVGMTAHSNVTDHLLEALNAICGGYRRAGDSIQHRGALFELGETTERVAPPMRSWENGPKLRTVDSGLLYGEFPTSRLPDEILCDAKDRVRALISFGGNPATAIGGTEKTIKALKSLDLLVSIDPRMTETGRYAHYVIPTKLPFEHADLSITQDNWYVFNQIQYSDAIIEAPAGIMEDWEVYWELARLMGLQLEFRTGPFSVTLPQSKLLDMKVKPTTEEMLQIACSLSKRTLEEIRGNPSGIFPCEAVVKPAAGDDGARLDVCPPDVAGEIAAVLAEALPAPADGEYVMVARRVSRVMNTAYHGLQATRKKFDICPVYLHPADAQKEGFVEGEIIELHGMAGTAAGQLVLDPTMGRSVVAMPMGWGSSDPEDEHSMLTSRLVSLDNNLQAINYMPQQTAIRVTLRRGPGRAELRKTIGAAI